MAIRLTQEEKGRLYYLARSVTLRGIMAEQLATGCFEASDFGLNPTTTDSDWVRGFLAVHARHSKPHLR